MMSSSESEAGTLNALRSTPRSSRLRRDVEGDPDARDHALAVLLGHRKILESTRGFESGIGCAA
jgi:hypothetical protein